MYQRILVPLDGSAAALAGLAEAIRVAASGAGRIRLVHVINVVPLVSAEATPATLQSMLSAARSDSESLLERAARDVRKAGIQVESKMLRSTGGPVGAQIIREAQAWPADLIVCGTHGRRGVSRLLLGSDAEYIVRHSRVPVLLRRPDSSVRAEPVVSAERAEPAISADDRPSAAGG
jgi:nucleotide-binding universal stress UspA family protein